MAGRELSEVWVGWVPVGVVGFPRLRVHGGCEKEEEERVWFIFAFTDLLQLGSDRLRAMDLRKEEPPSPPPPSHTN